MENQQLKKLLWYCNLLEEMLHQNFAKEENSVCSYQGSTAVKINFYIQNDGFVFQNNVKGKILIGVHFLSLVLCRVCDVRVFLFGFGLLIKYNLQGWKDGSVVKSTYFSSIGTEFRYQHPQCVSHKHLFLKLQGFQCLLTL